MKLQEWLLLDRDLEVGDHGLLVTVFSKKVKNRAGLEDQFSFWTTLSKVLHNT